MTRSCPLFSVQPRVFCIVSFIVPRQSSLGLALHGPSLLLFAFHLSFVSLCKISFSSVFSLLLHALSRVPLFSDIVAWLLHVLLLSAFAVIAVV